MSDFLIDIEYEGITSRLKRLSDTLLYSTKDLYKSEGLDIDPNWNLIFRLLQEHEEMTITEMADTLQFSHPAVIKIVKKMKKQGYINSYADENDKRKQVLSLTSKANKHIKTFETYWLAGTKVVEDLFKDSPNLLRELTKIEEKVNQLDYKQRVLLKLKTK
ncbi:MarR family transcriptional regulator [Winogradskyella echinorum]|uniref:MarR family transcriptional regulator n=1 Tax=Winogradskyella echinorum TaxID=538189 RepID=A0ABR6Y0R5_9FLAO|nr:MarR family transcriptional regulator [Winogradskyella echinorum]MBC3846336.1 MarR family transcriptional regulator [Winogradskyella echinorum]MBC5750684.1 MarR family transcriptional regulator [Winogradskyella echinorum]